MSGKIKNLPEPIFLSAPKTANLCGVSRNTLCSWIRDGKLSSYSTAGGKYLIRPTDLMRFMMENQMFIPPGLAELVKEDEQYDPPGAPKTADKEPGILIVEDDPDMRMIMNRSLSKLNLPIEEAGNGFEALHKLTVNPLIALVILDMIMPGQGGAETFEVIRKNYPSVPVIIVTGRPLYEVEATFAKNKPDFILSKPFDAKHLNDVCNTFLNNLGF
ncbi:MAG: response regulator [Verrucomicrobia bacterium]|nr:response regulator [Verrucomicrobiota bacterium]MCH8528443.1 response regulator [Kiritimatiellia bacterium]